ncbi:diguanylate cyclase [Thalassobaculum sp.]|uniref:diguanylate cyclase n=1 Tax=Thalassobaculum sp. TaxID=2022740 RepID=UPI0032EDB4E7
MTDPNAQLSRRLDALRVDYVLQLPDRIAELRAAWLAIQRATDADTREGALVQLRRIAHRLVGSGKTFGLPAVSEAAIPIEQLADALLDGDAAAQTTDVGALVEQLARLDFTNIIAEAAPAPAPLRPAPRSARPAPEVVVGLIWLTGLTEDETQYLSTVLQRYGFTVDQLEPDDVPEEIREQRPAAVVAGMDGVKEVVTGERWDDPATPLVVISSDDRIEARLSAVRIGASGFVTRPFSGDQLVDLLDRLLEHADPEPYRVILVEDDDFLAESFSTSLEAENMRVERLADPMKILKVCQSFAPDIIVTDLYLPEADGMEMAQVIRQHGGFDGVPILFVSSETSLNRQMTARRFGADDFLTKPLTSAQLVTAVRSRAIRYRELRRLMDRDSLTGLLNHGRTVARLEREIDRCREAGEPLSVAALDLDHFKRVNDTYGHAAGDRVLRTVSRLFLQRLRGTDAAGRFGGEEFVLVLPSADAEAAFNLLDKLREAFASIEHVFDEHRFSATCSIGLATLRDDDDQTSLLARADAALYQAKQDGRNRIGLE